MSNDTYTYEGIEYPAYPYAAPDYDARKHCTHQHVTYTGPGFTQCCDDCGQVFK